MIDKYRLTCQHEDHEDCLICAICGQCREDLDEDDICEECQDRMSDKEQNKMVKALLIENEYGVSVFVAETEQELKDRLYKYVEEWWSTELSDDQMPDDRDTAIEDYFELLESESYLVVDAELSDSMASAL